MNLKKNSFVIIIISCLFVSCKNENKIKNKDEKKKINKEISLQEFQNKGHELVYNMVKKVGDYNTLLSKNDVTYTYTYLTPDGEKDISTEKYIFNGEYSYGMYKKHERTLPELEGIIEQGYDGNEYWLKHNKKLVQDEKALKRVAFNRPTNFYWFTMMQKLLDKGLNYEYLGEKSINNNDYDIVKTTFSSIYNKPKDIYQLYINKNTGLVDQFLFTVADFDMMSPKLMQVKYKNIEGLLIPTQRQYKNSTWDADVTDEPWIKVLWTEIKFNTGISKQAFKK